MTATKYQLVAYDNEDNGPEDPMVSEPIHPFIIPVTITGPQSGRPGEYGALIDSGCTRCLISQVVAAELGIQVREMPKPMKFKQVDGSLLPPPATHIMEPGGDTCQTPAGVCHT